MNQHSAIIEITREINTVNYIFVFPQELYVSYNVMSPNVSLVYKFPVRRAWGMLS